MSDLQLPEVAAATERIKLRLRRTAEDIVAIGQDLITIKTQLPHGQFLPWIERHFEMSEDTAGRFINVASRLGSNSALCGISPTVLYALSAPSTPESVVQAITEKAEAGESVTVAEVKALKQQVKDAQAAKQTAIRELEEFTSKSRFAAQAKAEAEAEIVRLTGNVAKLNEHIDKLQNRPPDVVETERIVEVIPEGYASAQAAIDDLQKQRQALTDQVFEHRQTLLKLKQQSTEEGKVNDLRRELRIMCNHLDKTFAQIAERQTLVLHDPMLRTDPACQEMLQQAHSSLIRWAELIQDAGLSVNVTPQKPSRTIHMVPTVSP